MAAKPPLLLLAPTQTTGAIAELLGQREIRLVHRGSTIRALIFITISSFVEAILVLSLCQTVLPHHITDGQV